MIKRKKKNHSFSKGKKLTNKKKKIILNILLVGIITFIILICVFFAYIVIKAPKFDPNNLKYQQMSIVYDRDGNVIDKLGSENRTEITYDEIPEVLLDAIIATEDSKFFEHNGFDLPRFLVASTKQVLGKGGGGASTLTMQIVKNNYTSTTASGFEGIVRKFTDIYLAVFKVEKKYTKKEIIEFYVNDSYLGNGAYGVEQASKNYFGKSVSELNLAEASFIAGLFQSPSYYNPYNYPEKAESRRNTVLYLMQRHGYITKEEREIAKSKNIKDLVMQTQVSNDYSTYQGYIDTVIEELENEYNLSPYTTPLLIYTAMSKEKQDFVNKVMNGEAWKWENDAVQAGVVMTDSYTGEVLAVGAGRNKNTKRSFNYATMTNRHIGSTAKPIFDYGPAVEYLGYGTVNYIVDEPYTYSNGKKINNSDNGYKGTLPMYQALGLSRNVTALKTFQKVSKEAGNEKIVEFATRLGITPEIEGGKVHEAHAIGSFTGSTKKGESRTSPMTMAGAYGAFSNGGTYIKPHTITKYVYKENDEVVTPSIEKHKAMEASTAYIITYALHWSATEGMAKSAANISGVQVAAKTGTSNIAYETLRAKGISSNHVNDLWVCGYTPSQTITFWYGYDELNKEHYSTTATWNVRDRFYKNLASNLFDKTGASFKAPSDIVSATVVKNSNPLKLASSNTPEDMKVVGYFKKGTTPEKVSTSFDALPSVSNIKSTVDGNNITLTWNGISAEKMLELEAEENFGSLVYEIYIKDGVSGTPKLLTTTTSTKYTTTTEYDNPIFIIYTTYENYKTNKSKGIEHSVTVKNDFEVKIGNETIYIGGKLSDDIPIIVLYNSIDVTDESTIESISNDVNTNVAGEYHITYKVTYMGHTKTITEKVTVKEDPAISVNP